MKITDLRALVRRQLIGHLEEELRGGESLMKEVYENLDTDDEMAIVRDELREIVRLIKERDR